MMLPSSQMSEIDILLSQVNVFLSKIDVMLSKCPDVHSSRSPVLPRMGNILSKMESIVSQHLFDTTPATNLSWDDAGHEMWYHDEDDDDDNYSLSTFGNEEEEESNYVTSQEKDDNKVEENTGKENIGDDNEEDDQEEEVFSVADRVKARRSRPRGVCDAPITTPTKPPSPSRSEEIGDPRKKAKKKKSDPILAAITRAIGKVAPKSVYNTQMGEKLMKQRAAKKVANVVPDIFRSLWESMKEEEIKVTVPDPYPTLDWTKVNKRFIQNIPMPTLLPIHSCSADPNFYEWSERKGNGGTVEKVPSQFERRSYYLKKGWANAAGGHVFGGIYGYETSEGIISVSSISHHGYIWDNGSWILHSQLPKDKAKENKFEYKKKVKRKKV